VVRHRVLIVEDESSQRALLKAALSADYDVITADTGAKALEAAPGADLVLLDAGLPDMDGIELCRTFKKDKDLADIPVVFLTARDATGDQVTGLEAGAIDYLTKPVNLEVLRARVRTYVQLKSQRDELTKLATVDGLTGIANRRSFDVALSREWRRLARTGQALSVILMDVDHFKQFNDNYGHAMGDDCLRQVARAAADAIKRPADLVARYGGEEFVVLLPETDLEGAKFAAEAIRVAIAGLKIPHKASSAADHVTVSLGVAQAVPADSADQQALVEAADKQLYKAKKDGRNRFKAGLINEA
jgi:diguanylate cyclase (GGDEF)-like protein